MLKPACEILVQIGVCGDFSMTNQLTKLKKNVETKEVLRVCSEVFRLKNYFAFKIRYMLKFTNPFKSFSTLSLLLSSHYLSPPLLLFDYLFIHKLQGCAGGLMDSGSSGIPGSRTCRASLHSHSSK